jgi:hypothetical protein
MCTKNVLGFVVVEELFDSVGSELNDIPRAIRVSNEVRLNTEFGIVVCGIAPKDIHY